MGNAKTALITGIAGQDGAHLAEFLLEKGYEVHGLVRWDSMETTQRLSDMKDDIHLHFGDMTDPAGLIALVQKIRPHEIYNLAAMSHVAVSFETAESTANINGLGTLRLLEAIRIAGLERQTRFYQASSSELFGNALPPQNESTPFQPCSPYGVAKLYAYWITVNYRDSYGLHASNGILFNHESPLRGEDFVTRKITRAVAAIERGEQDVLYLGNLNSRRDWGHARDYVRGMWMMLQQSRPGDYVLATGQAKSVRDFVEEAFSYIGRPLVWRGAGLDEKGYDARTGKMLVAVDPAFFRPNEVHCLIGDAAKARQALGWRPEMTFEELVRDMVNTDRGLGQGDDRPCLRLVK